MREEGCETFWWEWPTRPSLLLPFSSYSPSEDKIATSRKEERRACHVVQGREGVFFVSPLFGAPDMQ